VKVECRFAKGANDRKARTLNRLVLLLVPVALLVAGCGNEPATGAPAENPAAATHTLTGTMLSSGQGCDDYRYDYDTDHAPVRVTDETGTLIGTTTTSGDVGPLCTVTFTVKGLPTAKFYEVTIGTHQGPSYSYEELEASDWNIALEI
jgi:hypothetical protein